MVQFAIDPGRTALVIVDMQNCFDGSSTGLLRQIVPRVAAGVINNDARTAAPRPLTDVRPDDIVVGKPRFDLPDGGLGPGQRGRAAARRGRRDGVRLRLDRFLRPDAGPDPGSGHGLSSILTAILALAIQEQ